MVFDLGSIGKTLLILGMVIMITGGIMLLAGRVPFLGNLPGDLRIQRDNWGCYVPLATSILISLILTVLLNVLARIFGK